jgi:SAM-dependent methyltransferase
MFDREEDQVRVKPRFREGITWHLGDARDPGLVGALGLQDIVVANRFLCHMHPEEAEECLCNLARLVKPGGYLFVFRCRPRRADQSRSGARLATGDGADQRNPRGRSIVATWLAFGILGFGAIRPRPDRLEDAVCLGFPAWRSVF